MAVTRSAAVENASYGIRVNAVCPGPTAGTDLMTNMLSSKPEEEDHLKQHLIPMGKLGTVIDVARTVTWLCSDFSGHITGETVAVDGGMHLR